MSTSNGNLIRRADLAIADIQAGGGLSHKQADRFIDIMLDVPTLLQSVRVERMNSPTQDFSKVGFKSRILRAARQGGNKSGHQDDGSNTRYLTEAERSKPDFDKISLATKEVMAEVHLTYEELEDNIEGRSFQAHLIRLIAERAALDLEELVLNGDTTNADPYLALLDGVIKQSVSHTVDNTAAGVSPSMFANGMIQMPQKYLRNLNILRNYTTIQDTIRYREEVAKRQTGYGDTALQRSPELYVHGIRMDGLALMPVNVGLLTFPKNIIFGVQRRITLETERDIRGREIIIVVTARVDAKFEEEDAVVKYININ